MENFIWSGIGVDYFHQFRNQMVQRKHQAKSELRQDNLNEIADEGKKIYNVNEVKILQENTNVMQFWIKSNPKKAGDFLSFKDGFGSE